MQLPEQKNFYDVKRYFQGKDNPGDAHPEPTVTPPARGQIIFGVLFLVVLALLFALHVTGSDEEPSVAPAKAPTQTAKK